MLIRQFQHPLPYRRALALMKKNVEKIQNHAAPEQIWLLEHPHVYTAGSSAQDSDLLDNTTYEVVKDAGRGGQWTYHGPGQRIIWVMLDLHHDHGFARKRDVRSLVTNLENWLIKTLSDFHISSHSDPRYPGIWVTSPSEKKAKIAALGLRISKWVSWHGVSINVSPCLEAFNGIIPCGIKDYGVTSMQQLGVSISLKQLDQQLIKNWPAYFNSTPIVHFNE